MIVKRGTTASYKWTITDAFDNNHILSITRKTNGENRKFWWGLVPPTEEKLDEMMNRPPME
jgi:hypothetical protein